MLDVVYWASGDFTHLSCACAQQRMYSLWWYNALSSQPRASPSEGDLCPLTTPNSYFGFKIKTRREWARFHLKHEAATEKNKWTVNTAPLCKAMLQADSSCFNHLGLPPLSQLVVQSFEVRTWVWKSRRKLPPIRNLQLILLRKAYVVMRTNSSVQNV